MVQDVLLGGRIHPLSAMTKQKALDAFRNLYEEIDQDNWLFVGTLNPEMVMIAINAIEESMNEEQQN